MHKKCYQPGKLYVFAKRNINLTSEQYKLLTQLLDQHSGCVMDQTEIALIERQLNDLIDSWKSTLIDPSISQIYVINACPIYDLY